MKMISSIEISYYLISSSNKNSEEGAMIVSAKE